MNGMLVNSVRVSSHALKSGDTIAVGDSHKIALGARHTKPLDELEFVYEFKLTVAQGPDSQGPVVQMPVGAPATRAPRSVFKRPRPDSPN